MDSIDNLRSLHTLIYSSQTDIDKARLSLESIIPQIEEEIQRRDSEIVNLNQRIQTLESQKQNNLEEISTLKVELSQAEQIITELQEQIRILKEGKPVPPSPIEISPDITVSVSGLGSFRPSLKGERQGKEIRYTGDLKGVLNVIIDVKDDGQVATSIEHVKVSDPVIIADSEVRLGSVSYNHAARFHHNTRPRLIINPSKPPKVDLPFLVKSGLIPNYLSANNFTEDDLVRTEQGRYPWNRWEDVMKSKSAQYDLISEEFGQIHSSWTSGAGAKINESSHLMPLQVLYLLTQDPRAWTEVVKLANSSGNYPVHYKVPDSTGGHFPLPSETELLPFLNSADDLTLKTASGVSLPIPNVSHQHSLVYLAYLLTGERWYREELEAWVSFNLLTRPMEYRLSGIIWSGQVRASAWALRALLNLALSGTDKVALEATRQIRVNLNWMTQQFTIPGKSPYYLQTGITSILDYRPSPFLDNSSSKSPNSKYTATWHHSVLLSVLNECVRAGFVEAVPMRDHLLKVTQGLWSHSPTIYDTPYGNHSYISDDWQRNIAATFYNRPSKPTSFQPPLTPDYLGWYRSGLVAGVDAGKISISSLNTFDSEAGKFKGGVPLAWQINPVKGNTP